MVFVDLRAIILLIGLVFTGLTLCEQQNRRTERGVVVVREYEKEQEVRSGLCTLDTDAENRGTDLGCAGEPAQLSGEAAAVKGKLGGTAQAGED